jgi:tartrate dehydrogenase/decarboxylase/D-malate dehydrogenase
MLRSRRKAPFCRHPVAGQKAVADGGHEVGMASLNSHGFVNPRDIEQMWRDQFDWVYENYDHSVFALTIHPDVSGKPQGDILSDLGPACTGTIGIAPSANINPERKFPSLFEPVHGSAPDIAGKGIANPVDQIWAGAMMLGHLGHPQAAAKILAAIETVLADGNLRTRDLAGRADTRGCGAAIAQAVAA